MSIYTTTVVQSKEFNLMNRAGIFWKHFIPPIIGVLWEDFWWSICEIWSGMWHKLQIMRKSFPEATISGIEPSDAMRGKSDIPLLNGSLQKTWLPDTSQDVVCLFQMWHHINPNEYQKCISEIKRILKPGWKIFLLDTFAPETEEGVLKELIFSIANRFYAVLSQYPEKSLIYRTWHAMKSVVMSEQYSPQELWYFSPQLAHTRMCFEGHNLQYNPEHTHKYGISQLHVFSND